MDDRGAERTTRLRAALTSAASVGFHRDRLPQSQFDDPWDILEQTPSMFRRDLQMSREALLDPLADRSDWVVVSTTGSTGEPVSVVHDRASRSVEEQTLSSLVERHGQGKAWQDKGLVHVVMHPAGRSRATRSGWSATATATKWNVSRAWQLDDSQLRARLMTLSGFVVTGSPSTWELLAGRLSGGAMPRPALVVLSGEPVSPEVRELVASALHCPVVTVYALGETGILGVECPDGGYHIDPSVAVVELLGDSDDPVSRGTPGEVTVTTLANRAMPLVRYRTGDQAIGLFPCGCGQPGTRIRLSAVRPARWVVAEDGTALHHVRFVKLWRTLQVSRAHIRQDPAGGIEAVYWAPRPLTDGEQSIVVGSLRSSVGPGVPVRVTWRMVRGRLAPLSARPRPAAGAESLPDAPAEVAAWLRHRLHDAPRRADAVLITGSALEVTRGTRFSDVDVTVLDGDEQGSAVWVEWIRDLRSELPRLRVNIEDPAGLAERSPLVLARMCAERLPVVGDLPTKLLAGPSREALRRESRTWACQAVPLLWQRLTDPGLEDADPVNVAYLAQKFIADACRFRHLLAGGSDTRLIQVARAELPGLTDPAGVTTAWEAIEVARELRPPPRDGDGSPSRYLSAAVTIVRRLARRAP